MVGIWFYDDADCDRISALLQRIASTFAAPSEAGAGAAGVRSHGRHVRGVAIAQCCVRDPAYLCLTQ